jgi:methionine sulfoxide reductase heme-binding subunit
VSTRDPLEYVWWLAARSAGIVAFLLLSAAVVAGLALALRLGSPRLRVGVRAVHERIALLALGAVAAHGLFLLLDPWLKPGLGGLLVPFTTSYRPLWTGLGVLAGYLAAGLSLTFYARKRLGTRRWRQSHRFIPIAWALAAVHVVGAGTDGRSRWLLVPLAVTVGLIVVMLAVRWSRGRRAPAPVAKRMRPPVVAPEPVIVPERVPASPADAAPGAGGPPAPLWSRVP